MSLQSIRLNALERQTNRLFLNVSRLSNLSRRYSWIRLLLFGGGALITAAVFHWIGSAAGWISLIAWIISFGSVVYVHRRIQASISRHVIWNQIKRAQIARLRLDWQHIPQRIRLEPDSQHPFEADLDLTGARSLHHLINTATSEDGGRRLHDWLTDMSPTLDTILRRQALVQELSRLPRFRDKLILYSTLRQGATEPNWNRKTLVDWLASGKTAPSLRPTLVVLAGLSALNITLFALYNQNVIAPWWVITFVSYAGLWLSKILRAGGLFEQAQTLGALLESLQTVFAYLETYPYADNRHLRELAAPFLNSDNRPSKHLRRVTRVISAASLQRTQVLWLIVNAIVPWDIYFAHRLDKLKADLSDLLPHWLDTWFELEALNSLANLAYLRPDYVYPDVRPAHDITIFRGQGLGHPLLADAVKVTNDFALLKMGQVIIITGSNMSGKSSFLRTLGINLCLANAGGPVNATLLQTQVFRVFTCMKVSDSVTDGISYFYAEVKRLKALLSSLEADDPRPLFFLIDEIFRGTNNRERLIGSRAYVRALTGKNGVGVVSTHDLELVRLADSIPAISNYHFEDTIADGKMTFDYRLRPGPSLTTNALRIMAIEGLPTPPHQESESDSAV